MKNSVFAFLLIGIGFFTSSAYADVTAVCLDGQMLSSESAQDLYLQYTTGEKFYVDRALIGKANSSKICLNYKTSLDTLISNGSSTNITVSCQSGDFDFSLGNGGNGASIKGFDFENGSNRCNTSKTIQDLQNILNRASKK